MADQTMIERMARTYYERTHGEFIRDCEAPDDPPIFEPSRWDAASIVDRDHHIANARAVLTAMLEPTPSMIERGFNHMEANGNDPRFAWEAMIDAALGEDVG